MKTKKISWQAIAIVVLALVLIASIALGVSGAWFQDKDSESTELTLGKAVTIKLVETGKDSDPVTWQKTYTGDAFPGDLVFGATSIKPGVVNGEAVSAAVYRIKISAKVEGAPEWYDATVTEKPTDTTAADYGKKLNSYWFNQIIAGATDATFKGNWTEGKTAGTDGLKWYYYNKVNQSSAQIRIFDELRLSNEITNMAAETKISVTVNVEAIQAANINAAGEAGNADWRDDMPATLATAISDYENGRKPTVGP